MPRKRAVRRYVPRLALAIVVGDRFVNKERPDVIYTVRKKEYHLDMTLSYILSARSIAAEPGGEEPPRLDVRVAEDSLESYPWVRIWATPQKTIYREHVFTGVFYGTAD